jgi:hypothetical protein
VLEQLWEPNGVGAALHRVTAGRRIDGSAAERVPFVQAAQPLAPAKMAATRWATERVAIATAPIQRRLRLRGNGFPLPPTATTYRSIREPTDKSRQGKVQPMWSAVRRSWQPSPQWLGSRWWLTA